MGNGLNERNVRVENIFQNIFRVSGRGNAQYFELRILRFDLSAQVLEHLDRVLNRIAVRQLIRFAQDVAVFAQQDGFGGGRSTVDADESAYRAVLRKYRGSELLRTVCFLEEIEVLGLLDQTLAPRLGFFFLATVIDVVDQFLVAAVATDAVVLTTAKFHGSQGSEILCVLRNFD